MRTTLDIEDDVLAAAKDLAKAEGRTAGAVISDLARRAMTQSSLGASLGASLGTSRGTSLSTSLGVGLEETQMAYNVGDATGNGPAVGDFPTFPHRDGMPVTNDVVRRLQDAIDLDDAGVDDRRDGTPGAQGHSAARVR